MFFTFNQRPTCGLEQAPSKRCCRLEPAPSKRRCGLLADCLSACAMVGLQAPALSRCLLLRSSGGLACLMLRLLYHPPNMSQEMFRIRDLDAGKEYSLDQVGVQQMRLRTDSENLCMAV